MSLYLNYGMVIWIVQFIENRMCPLRVGGICPSDPPVLDRYGILLRTVSWSIHWFCWETPPEKTQISLYMYSKNKSNIHVCCQNIQFVPYNVFPLDIQVFIICNKIFCQIVLLLYKRIKGYTKKRKSICQNDCMNISTSTKNCISKFEFKGE